MLGRTVSLVKHHGNQIARFSLAKNTLALRMGKMHA
jgi:hypothetical protein